MFRSPIDFKPFATVLVLIVFGVLSSCKVHNLTFIKDKNVVFDEDERDSIYQTYPPEYKLDIGDQLYIKIFSPEKSVEEELRSQSQGGASNSFASQREDFLNGHIINPEGKIEIPIIGQIYVRDMTIGEARQVIQQEVDKFLVNGKVVTKLLSFKVTFLGEVGQQKTLYFYQHTVNVLEAMAEVGSISPGGRVDKVLILRKRGDTFRTIHVDLTDRNILSKPDFYLQPHDIVYVEPYRSKAVRVTLADYSLILATITSTISTLLLIINLSK